MYVMHTHTHTNTHTHTHVIHTHTHTHTHIEREREREHAGGWRRSEARVHQGRGMLWQRASRVTLSQKCTGYAQRSSARMRFSRGVCAFARSSLHPPTTKTKARARYITNLLALMPMYGFKSMSPTLSHSCPTRPSVVHSVRPSLMLAPSDGRGWKP